MPGGDRDPERRREIRDAGAPETSRAGWKGPELETHGHRCRPSETARRLLRHLARESGRGGRGGAGHRKKAAPKGRDPRT